MSPEQRYKIEQLKNQTPGTNSFLLWIPAFVFIAWMCHSDIPIETAHAAPAQEVNVLHWLGLI